MVVAERHVFPGRISPGLIEAVSAVPRQLCGCPFPGRISPGLIEASSTGSRPATRRDFPGESARASLKQVGCGCAERVEPYESARASLKLVPQEVWLFIGPNFPGESARASLKRGTDHRTDQDRYGISRANQPGPH